MAERAVDTADELAVQQLRSFCLVFEKQSYSAAAKEIGLAVPTIWEQVRTLEKRYATTLFSRRGRRIQPTPAATLLYQSLRPLLAGLDSTFEVLREGEGEYPPTITIATGARMMLEDLGQPLARFRSQYPGVCLRLLDRNAKEAEELVVAGEADLGLTLEPAPNVLGKGVSIERAYPIEYLALFPKRHPLARQARVSLQELATHPLILGHSGTYGRQLFEQALHREGLSGRVQIMAETDTSAFTIACVRAGMGIGIVAGRPTGFLSRDLVARSLASQLGQAWIAMLWKRGKHLTRTVQSLMGYVREAGEMKSK
jgi:DNA-binding transcriptional LysR family regulator